MSNYIVSKSIKQTQSFIMNYFAKSNEDHLGDLLREINFYLYKDLFNLILHFCRDMNWRFIVSYPFGHGKVILPKKAKIDIGELFFNKIQLKVKIAVSFNSY